MRDRTPTLARRVAWAFQAFGYDLLRLGLRALPLDWASAFGGWVVESLGPLTSKHRIVLRNMALAFPDRTEAERQALARRAWNALGRTVAEFPLMDRLTPAGGRVEVVGMERLHAIRDSGEPAVLVSGHLSNWEVMMAVIVESGLDCRVSYRPANNPYVDRRITESRRRYGVELFAPKGGDGTRELIAALARGKAVALLNDQRDNAGVEAPFFGRLVRTAPGPARLALKYGGRIVPLSVARLKGARFRVTIHEPVVLQQTGDRGADLVAAVTEINRFVEQCIRERPAEWLWQHRKWPLECYADLKRKGQTLATGNSPSDLRREGPA